MNSTIRQSNVGNVFRPEYWLIDEIETRAVGRKSFELLFCFCISPVYQEVRIKSLYGRSVDNAGRANSNMAKAIQQRLLLLSS